MPCRQLAAPDVGRYPTHVHLQNLAQKDLVVGAKTASGDGSTSRLKRDSKMIKQVHCSSAVCHHSLLMLVECLRFVPQGLHFSVLCEVGPPHGKVGEPVRTILHNC